MKTLQEQYNLIKEGRGNKEILLKTAKQLYPNVIPNHFTYNQAVPLLKQRGLLHESIGGVVTKGKDPDWFTIFKKNTHILNEGITPEDLIIGEIYDYSGEVTLGPKTGEQITGTVEYVGKHSEQLYEFKWVSINDPRMEKGAKVGNSFIISDEGLQYLSGPTQNRIDQYNQREKDVEQYGMGYLRHLTEAKAIEKKPTKEIVDMEVKGYDYKNKENIDNIYGQAFLIGYYAEMKDPANADKTVDDLKAIVAKNLYKDPLYYVKNGQFGIKGVGYTDEAPGLTASKTDQMTLIPDQVKPRASKTDLGDREKKTGAAKKVKGEMTITPKSSKGVKKMPLPGKEKKIRLKEAWEGAEFDTGKFDDGPQPPDNDDLEYSFSEYDFSIPYNMKEYIKKEIKAKYSNISDEIIDKKIENAEDYFYSEARKENKRGREYPSVHADDIIDLISADIKDIDSENLEEQKLRSVISKLIKEELQEAWDTMGQGYGEEGMYSFEDKLEELYNYRDQETIEIELQDLISKGMSREDAIDKLYDITFITGLDIDENIEKGAMDDQIAQAEKIVAQKKKEAAEAEKKSAELKAKEASAEANT